MSFVAPNVKVNSKEILPDTRKWEGFSMFAKGVVYEM